jgi:hypothetical protein
MVLYEAAPAVADLIIAEMHADIRPDIKDVATTTYAAYAEELYGTGPPPRMTGSRLARRVI